MNSRILSLSATGNTLLKASVADTMSRASGVDPGVGTVRFGFPANEFR